VAIDRRSTFAFAPLHARATRRIAADFLRRALAPALPYAAPTVLIDHSFRFFDRTPPSAADTARPLDHEPTGWRVHAFTYACEQLDIGHA
jgi:hypothetical protein